MTDISLEKKKEILEARLVKIRNWRKEYWENNDPSIPDIEYAKFLQKTLELINSLEDTVEFKHIFLAELNEIEFPEFKNAPKVKRHIPMLSLKNEFTYSGIKAWMEKYARSKDEEYSIDIKYDGMAANNEFDGQLLSTRGSKDGLIGQNISRFFPILEIDGSDSDFSGELIIKNSKFNEYNDKYFYKRKEGKYKTPRSMVQALLNTDNLEDLPKDVSITYIQHGKHALDIKYSEFNEEKFYELVGILQEKFKDYPSDGIVISLKDKQYFNKLGHNGKFPYGAIAYKFEEEVYESILLDVVLQRGKHILTPVAKIAPINLKDGTQIRSPSLRNAKILKDFDAHIGDTVIVKKRAEVIPFIEKIIPGKNRISLNDKVSKCGCEENADVEYREPYFYCSNPKCKEGIAKNIYEACKILEIEDIGLPTISKIVHLYNLKDFVDLLRLQYEHFRRLPGFADSKSRKIYNNIQKAKNTYDYKILSCLSIRGIGEKISKELCSKFTLKQVYNMTPGQLVNEKITDIGIERATSIIQGLTDNFQLLGKCYKYLNVQTTKGMKETDSKGIVCFSGKFPQNKSIYEQKAKIAGYTVISNMNNKVNYLVISDNGPTSSKITKAQSNGFTKILKLRDFLELIN